MSAVKMWDRIFLAAAFAGLLLASAWTGWCRWAGGAASRGERATVSGDTYHPGEVPVGETKMSAWEIPPASHGRSEWACDLFTPPEISYDPQTRQFVIVPHRLENSVPVETFGLQLTEVGRAPFRLQLVGFMGNESNPLGLFENQETTELIVARAGSRVHALEVAILTFEIKYEQRQSPERMSFREKIAMARVRDERTGEEVALTDRERGYAGPLIVTLVTDASPADRHELRAGERLELDDVSYELEKAELVPPHAELIKRDADQAVLEKRILTVLR